MEQGYSAIYIQVVLNNLCILTLKHGWETKTVSMHVAGRHCSCELSLAQRLDAEGNNYVDVPKGNTIHLLANSVCLLWKYISPDNP